MTPPSSEAFAALEARLHQLEARLTALEQTLETERAADVPLRPANHTPAPSDFWALDTLIAQAPQGAVLLAGTAPLPAGERYEWQTSQDLPSLLNSRWDAAATILAALGHPLRLAILRAILHGQRAVADLGTHPELSGAGKLYHHLRDLQAAGWLAPVGRGRYVVPAGRVVPLLVILHASGGLSAEDPPVPD